MTTRNHEDIARIAGPTFLRGTFAKDKRSLDTLCLGKPHLYSKRRNHDRDFKKEMLMKSQNKGTRNRIRGPDDLRVSTYVSSHVDSLIIATRGEQCQT